MYNALADVEKGYSGLTDGCAGAGKAGCKLVELIGENPNGSDVRALLDYAHDVGYSLLTLDNPTDTFFHHRWP